MRGFWTKASTSTIPLHVPAVLYPQSFSKYFLPICTTCFTVALCQTILISANSFKYLWNILLRNRWEKLNIGAGSKPSFPKLQELKTANKYKRFKKAQNVWKRLTSEAPLDSPTWIDIFETVANSYRKIQMYKRWLFLQFQALQIETLLRISWLTS